MRNVVVTGGTKGLGLATACRLAQSGYRVIAVARSKSEAFTAHLNSLPKTEEPSLVFKSCDLGVTEQLHGLIRSITQEYGHLYALVNNAGIGTSGILATMRNAEIETLTHLNVVSPIMLTKYAVRSMMVKGAGRVVNMSSIVGSTGYSGLSVYSATKAALTGFTGALARELGPLGITVNCVAPGFVDTDMTHSITGSQLIKIASRNALRRLPDANDVAGTIEFLLSDNARNITGTTITVDAGTTA